VGVVRKVRAGLWLRYEKAGCGEGRRIGVEVEVAGGGGFARQYACMHACRFVCMYVYLYVTEFVCTCVCIHACTGNPQCNACDEEHVSMHA